MKLLDANLLLYADNRSAPDHALAYSWLNSALVGTETLLVPWVTSLAFLRVMTHPHAVANPLTVTQAMTFIRGLLARPRVIVGEPDREHLDRVEKLLKATGVGGNLVNDAHLAALALQYDAMVVSFDNDFTRFPGVRWELPTVPPS